MSNKFLNPGGGDTDLSEIFARVNSNTEAIQDHVADATNPHTTSTDNIQGNNSPPLNSDDVIEGATNRYLVQPFVGNFDMGGNQILNTTAVGNPSGQMILAGNSTALIIDPSPTLGLLAQTGANQDINLISSADFDIKNLNAGDNIRLFGDGIQLKDQAGVNYLTLDATEITSFEDFNMNNNDITNVNVLQSSTVVNLASINGFTPQGGLFAGTTDSLILTASTAEQSILPTSFVGTLSVPVNGFQTGDSFHCVLAGDFGSNN